MRTCPREVAVGYFNGLPGLRARQIWKGFVLNRSNFYTGLLKAVARGRTHPWAHLCRLFQKALWALSLANNSALSLRREMALFPTSSPSEYGDGGKYVSSRRAAPCWCPYVGNQRLGHVSTGRATRNQIWWSQSLLYLFASLGQDMVLSLLKYSVRLNSSTTFWAFTACSQLCCLNPRMRLDVWKQRGKNTKDKSKTQ